MSGIFGVISSQDDCIETLFYGTDYHSHLGTEYGGIAVLGDEFSRQIHAINQTQFKSKFFSDCKNLKGKKGIGVISACDEQPIYLNSQFGPFCLVFNGFIENAAVLAKDLVNKGISFSEVGKGEINTAELIARLITQGDSLVDGIEKIFDVIEGSCSFLILNHDGVYAARDRYGYSSLVIGKRKDALAVASETSAFHNNHFEIVKYLEPGEIVLLNNEGLQQRLAGRAMHQICSFLWIYTGFPASSYDGINVEVVRENSGRFLARQDKGLEVDIVAGVPDSGIGHALGYAMESGIPYRRPLVKYTAGYGRSYTPPSQDTRDLIAKMKLIPIKEVIDGKRIVLCDDSIVRGTQLKNFTIKKLLWNGAKEIHVRIACPPLMFPCKFNLSTRNIHELAARKAIKEIEGYHVEDVSKYLDPESQDYKNMVKVIAGNLDVMSLKYQILDDMIKAIGLPKEKLCLYCWTGECAKKCPNVRCTEESYVV